MSDFATITAYAADLTPGDVFQIGPGGRWRTVTGPPEPSQISGCVDVPCEVDGEQVVVCLVRSDQLVTRRWVTPQA